MITTSLPSPIRRAASPRLTASLVTAFAADPAVRWLYPDARQYLTAFPEFVLALGGKAIELGTADTLDHLPCAALWLPPDVAPDENQIMDVLQRTIANPGVLAEMMTIVEQMNAFHPQEPHWYLPFIGVDPTLRGRGLGTVLMKKGITRCDHDRLPAYLESTSEQSVPLYERFGFKPVGQIQSKSSPPIIPMVRPARNP